MDPEERDRDEAMARDTEGKKNQPIFISEAAGDLSRLIATATATAAPAAAAHLVFGHHVGVLDQWRPDGWFVLQRLAQEGVMRITCIKRR